MAIGMELGGHLPRRGQSALVISLFWLAQGPGRPAERLEAVKRALEEGFEAVLGPTEDGGYDVLALATCPEGLLKDLPWSQLDTQP